MFTFVLYIIPMIICIIACAIIYFTSNETIRVKDALVATIVCVMPVFNIVGMCAVVAILWESEWFQNILNKPLKMQK